MDKNATPDILTQIQIGQHYTSCVISSPRERGRGKEREREREKKRERKRRREREERTGKYEAKGMV